MNELRSGIKGITGLTDRQVVQSRQQYGWNQLDHRKESGFLAALKSTLKEPMLHLLLAASTIYFAIGEIAEGIFMASSILLVASISLYQESRSRRALEALKNLTQPKSRVIRNGSLVEIPVEEIVVGDAMVVEEGMLVPADGIIIRSNDFTVNESILTGESLPVSKGTENNRVYQGTLVAGGLAVCRVESTGSGTRLGKIGRSIEEIGDQRSPLQIQIRSFVGKMAVIGIVFFLLVWIIHFSLSGSLFPSLLKALTLAMSILPEEIPVAFSVFMALGAWRLMKMGVVVKQTSIIETLGSATVICTDKTGTITENSMVLTQAYVHASREVMPVPAGIREEELKELITLGMWASEPVPFDPMEKALHEAYRKNCKIDERPSYKMIYEYPLDGKPPMMTHVFEHAAGHRIIAAKGAPEALMEVSGLADDERKAVQEALLKLTSEGYRVLGVGQAVFTGDDWPEHQQQLTFRFTGLVAFYDPPKKNIAAVFNAFYDAGIQVKIVTGDNAVTTRTIARQIGFAGTEHVLNGEELTGLDAYELQEKVMHTSIFSRVFPETKLRIIQALKEQGQVVAMTGDGVNDGPALKAAHIGIAMGKKGSEVARQAAALVLSDDNLERMVDAIKMGRNIYNNLRKAIRYIISIHIPIILIVFIPLALGWVYPAIFSPVHVIFLELIMGPTCSVVYENEPAEARIMMQPPRKITETFLQWKELSFSIIQGLVIALGTMLTYRYAVWQGYTEDTLRTMVFTALVVANIFLTLVNRSFYHAVFTTLKYRNPLLNRMILLTVVLLFLMLKVNVLQDFFQFSPLDSFQVLLAILAGFISVIWVEVYKWAKRSRQH